MLDIFCNTPSTVEMLDIENTKDEEYMEYEKMIKVQKRLSGYHSIILVFLFFIIAMEAVTEVYTMSLHMLYIVFLFVSIDYVLVQVINIQPKYHYRLLLVFRYIQIIGSSILLAATTTMIYPYFPYVFMFLMLSLGEYYVLFDIYESMYRIIYFISVSVIFVVVPLVIHLFRNENEYDLLRVYVLLIITVCIFITLSRQLAIVLERIHKRICILKRKVDSVNGINEQLRLHQEKLKKANEQLGVQKASCII